jgi:hypothetical protein
VQAYLRILSVYVNENLIDEAKEVARPSWNWTPPTRP